MEAARRTAASAHSRWRPLGCAALGRPRGVGVVVSAGVGSMRAVRGGETGRGHGIGVAGCRCSPLLFVLTSSSS